MSIEEIRRILRPPPTVSDVPDPPPWGEVEKQVGALPTDYKQYIEEYGTGKVDDFIVIFNPFSTNEFINLIRHAPRVLRAVETEVKSGSWSKSGAVDPRRLKPFGGTDNGDRLLWNTDGAPDEWTVMVLDSRGPYLDCFGGGVTGFLAALLEGRFRSKVFPPDFPGDNPAFTAL